MQVGAPMDLYHHPANLFVAGFIGSPRMNFLEVEVTAAGNGKTRVRSSDVGEIEVESATALSVGDTALLGVRPQYLSLAEPNTPGAAEGRLSGAVDLVERLGTETIVSMTLTSGQTLIGALDGDQPVKTGTSVSLAYDIANAHLFARE